MGGIQFSPGLGGAELEQVVAGDRAQLCCKGAGGTGLYGDAGLRVFVQGDEDGCAAQVFYLEGQPGPVVRGKTAALNLGLHGGAGGAVTKLRGLKRGCVRRRGWGTGGDKQGEKDGGREKTKTMSHIKAPFYGAGKMLLFFYSHRAGKTDRICEKRGTIFQVCGNGRS